MASILCVEGDGATTDSFAPLHRVFSQLGCHIRHCPSLADAQDAIGLAASIDVVLISGPSDTHILSNLSRVAGERFPWARCLWLNDVCPSETSEHPRALLAEVLANVGLERERQRLQKAVDEAEERYQQLQRLTQENTARSALYDQLTGVANRRLFVECIEEHLAISKRDPNYAFSILVVDIDNFRLLNDGFGYSSGDELLVRFIERLRGGLRSHDVVARLGPDQIGVVLVEAKNRSQTLEVVERIRTKLRKPFENSGREVYLTAGVGVALVSPDYVKGDEMLRDAEIALKRAKKQGKGALAVFERDMEVARSQLLELDVSLRRALARGELRPYYQPVVDVQTRRIVGFEALVRWEHPTRGLVAPGEFLPWAEDSGLIVDIGRSVFRQSFAQARHWQQSSHASRELVVSVNVSASHLHRADFTDEVRALVNEIGVEPAQLRLELTESVVINDSEQTHATLERLRNLGIRLSMDDFGTGYSSLSYLQRLAFDTLKIDRSFVNKLDTDAKSEHLTRAVLGIANGLGLSVVAEGVETEEQLSKLAQMGCPYAQGYLFSKAVPAAQAEQLLDQ